MPFQLPLVTGQTRHPFDTQLTAVYRTTQRYMKVLLRVREALSQKAPRHLKGQAKALLPHRRQSPPLHLPSPQAVRPVVTS